ncbi:PhzF family phenazine biosynthesis protein [Bacillus pinisoli]|uniref:PhzF family phenazine biosynthesis protein n=1 Tax=Bacillus pinisoli TaxID=2901866 RepID=UPI001FF5466D|nr:PhzF family phenazine biosynthesis protein [Bacillus pinisoli]
MNKLPYILLDVFTEKPFGGNQLAVFLNGEGLTTDTMQTIAKELNLSETVFMFPPTKDRPHFKLRIFTPAMELPFAGHPTIGTAFLLGEKNLVPGLTNGMNTVVVEENIGKITLNLYIQNGSMVKAEMVQPIPEIVGKVEDVSAVASLLSLPEEAIDSSLPIQSISAGIPFLFIPVKSLSDMENIKFRLDVWQERFSANENTRHIFAFSLETEGDAQVHSRMFAPALGISEDPATGSASGPLGFYLVQNKVIPVMNNLVKIISEQGIEMGRPSKIDITLEMTDEGVKRVLIGGSAFIMGEGTLFLNE